MLSILFPAICANCKKEGFILCNNCKKKLELHSSICPYCHKYSQDFKTCISCKTIGKNYYLNGLIICFSYNKIIKKLILKLKYYHKKSIASFLGEQLYINFNSNLTLLNEINLNKGNIIITGVPSHRIRRYFIKGYNQSFILAKEFAKKLGIKYKQIIYKNKNTKSQVSLGRNERKNNVHNVFSMSKKIKGNETIIIVDDITTTGSTINEIAQTIKKTYPNTSIWGIVLARHNH